MRRPFVLAALLVAMIAGGCGGGHNQASPTTTGNLLSGPAPTETTRPAARTHSPERFIAQADAICRRYLEKGAELPGSTFPTRAELISQAHQYAALLGDETAELASLVAPRGHAKEVAAWLSKQRRLQHEFAQFVPGSAAGAQRIERLFGELKTQSIALGLQKCFVVRLGTSGG